MLIKCPECGREISDTAISCPHCGFYRGLKCKDCAYWGNPKGGTPWCYQGVSFASTNHPACEQYKKPVSR